MPDEAVLYLENSWQATVLRYWITLIHITKIKYQYRIAKLLYFGRTLGIETLHELYDLFFVEDKKKESGTSQQDMQKLIEEYERIFGK